MVLSGSRRLDSRFRGRRLWPLHSEPADSFRCGVGRGDKGDPFGHAVRWEKSVDGLSYAVTVPSGATASVVVPEGMAPVDKKIVCDKSGIIEIGAGRHIILFR